MDKEYLYDLRVKANEAFNNKNFELAFRLSEKLAHEDDMSSIFTCGLIMEKGWANGVIDLDYAACCYKKLAIRFNQDEGYLGCVRIILARHEVENRETAMNYCLGATKGRLERIALLLRGRIYEELYEPPEYRLARKEYLKAFFKGSAWALRQHAMSLNTSGKHFAGSFMHVIATFVSPIILLLGGRDKARRS